MSGNIHHVHLCHVRARLLTLGLKLEEMSPEVQNKGISDPMKGHVFINFFLKKNKTVYHL